MDAPSRSSSDLDATSVCPCPSRQAIYRKFLSNSPFLTDSREGARGYGVEICRIIILGSVTADVIR